MKRVAVLCRGKSLNYLSSLPDIDEYVIVNNWAIELNQDFIIDKFSDGKPITHVLGLAAATHPHTTDFNVMKKHYKNFNINKIILPYLESFVEPNSKRVYEGIDGLNGEVAVEFLPETLKEYMWKKNESDYQNTKEFDLPTAGIAGILYATAMMNADEIYICGMDFYEELYAYGTDKEKTNNYIEVSQWETNFMKKFLSENIIDRFKSKKFFVNTYGNYNSELDNVSINNLNRKKVAVVAGGWHFPLHFYKQMISQKVPENWSVDYFCVSHRSPNTIECQNEKRDYLSSLGDSFINRMDKVMYENVATIDDIESLGWNYIEEPNTVGDWGISNQWLDKNDYNDYDLMLFTHDDNFIFDNNLFTEAVLQFDWDDWLVISNCTDIVAANQFNVRGSFDFFKKEIIEMLGGKFDLSMSSLTRIGKVDTPDNTSEIADWNYTVTKFGEFIKNNNLMEKIKRLSNTYRISNFCFEGERGFLSKGGDDTMLPIINYVNNNFDVEED